LAIVTLAQCSDLQFVNNCPTQTRQGRTTHPTPPSTGPHRLSVRGRPVDGRIGQCEMWTCSFIRPITDGSFLQVQFLTVSHPIVVCSSSYSELTQTLLMWEGLDGTSFSLQG